MRILKEKNLRTTPFRKEVLQIFLEADHAISVNDIEEQLVDFDRITLYRTIKSFIEKGVIHEIVMPGDVKMLALCDDICSDDEGVHSHQHVHFHCKTCDKIYCVETVDTPKIQIPGFVIDEKEIQARGICDKCAID